MAHPYATIIRSLCLNKYIFTKNNYIMKHFLLTFLLATSCMWANAQVKANNDTETTLVNTSVCIDVTKNDTGGPFSVPKIIQNPKKGSVSYSDSTNLVCYEPANGFVGKDTFRYKVCATGTNTCSEASVIITVNQNTTNSCVANFSFNATSVGKPTIFTNNSSGEYAGIVSWNFGDNSQNSNDVNPSHTYQNAGEYNVCLTIGSPNTPNCNKQICKIVRIIKDSVPPVACAADFSFSFSASNSNEVIFKNSSRGAYADISRWSFGDEGVSDNQSPGHVYNNPGTYIVCLIIGNPNTECRDTFCKEVVIKPQDTCNASFTFNLTQTQGKNYVGHVTLIKQRIKGGFIDFGDDTQLNYDDNPEHEYARVGTYNVCHFLPSCDTSFCEIIEVKAVDSTCNASFIITQTQAPGSNKNGHVTISKRTVGGVIDFGDGTPLNDSNKPEHDYTKIGTYIICHTLGFPNDSNQCYARFCDTIVVTENSTNACVANFNFIANSSLDVRSIKFTNASSGQYAGITKWNFGDNTISNDANPIHVYEKAGEYTVCLTIGTPNTPNCNKTVCKTVIIKAPDNEPCVSNFSWGVSNSGSDKRTLQFFNKSTGEYAGIVSWNFGDGTTSNEKNPIHEYGEAGKYTVCLTIGSPNTPNCNKTFCDSAVIASNDTLTTPCKTFFTSEDGEINELVYLFTNKSSGNSGNIHVWKVNGRNRSTGLNFEYNFANDSAYKAGQRSFEVCLTTGSPNTTCRGQYCEIIRFEDEETPECEAGFNAIVQNNPNTNGVKVQFNAEAAKQSPTPIFKWTFGDGSTSDNPNPVHVYNQAGQYRVCLTVKTGNDSCMRCETYTFKNPEPKPCGAELYAYQQQGKDGNSNGGNGEGAGCNTYNFGVYSTSNDLIDSVFIDFGDGTTFAKKGYDYYLSHKYAEVGTYRACAIIYQGNCQLVRCKDVVVQKGANHISGAVFFDRNANGTQDYNAGSYDIGIERNITIKNTRTGIEYHGISNNGYYYIEVADTGRFVVRCEVPANWNSTTANEIIVEINDYCTNVYGKNFGQKPNQEVKDLKVQVFIGRIRPGFNGEYYLSYQNLGGITMNGTVTFTYDNSKVAYNYSSVPHSSTTSNTVNYNFTGLTPGETRNIIVYITAAKPPVLNVGDTLCVSAKIEPIAGDNNPTDNTSLACGPVRGSFDPNDKAVLPAGRGVAGEVLGNQLLTYTIRFQNTGTDTAFNITLLDTLSQNVDANTLTIIASSTPNYEYSYNGSNRLLTMNFNNILLVDSFANEPLSHGFITYTIMPKEGLPLGTTITNKADIYFDFNEPVATNRTLNTTSLLLSVNSHIAGIYAVVMPNPMDDMATLSWDNATNSTTDVIITDVQGKIVRQATNIKDNKFFIERNELKAGMYFYNINQGGQTVSRGKVVIK